MITLSTPIQIIKQFNPAYSYPMDYEIYNTYDTDPNTLNDYGQVISFRFIRNQSTASELTCIFYLSDSLIPQEETISRTTTVKTFWFTNHVKRFRLVYKGLTAANINKIVELEYSYGNNTRLAAYPSGISFAKYHTGIKKCFILKEAIDTSGTATIKLFVVDRLDVTHCYTGNISSAIGTTIINNWGELNLQSTSAISNLPTNVLTELYITEATGIAPLTGIYTDRWFPSYNGCTPCSYSGVLHVDDKEDLYISEVTPSSYEYDGSCLMNIIDDTLDNNGNPKINQKFVNVINSYINNHKRMGLMISPSTIPNSNQDPVHSIVCHSTSIDNVTCYYSFPEWLLNIVLQLGENYGFYIKLWPDQNTGTDQPFIFLNWANSVVRSHFISCVETIANYINSSPVYKKHIEYIKIAYLGTWGEGYTLANPPAGCNPTYQDLHSIVEQIISLFGNDYLYLLGLRTALNGEFPENYCNEMIREGYGLYNDSVNNISNNWYLNGNGGYYNPTLSNASPKNINQASKHTKKYFSYLECEPHLTADPSIIPYKDNFTDLIAHAEYYNPDYYSLGNVLNHVHNGSISQNDAERISDDILELSHFVGSRPFLLLNSIQLLPQSLNVNLKIGNFGTSLIPKYWKLRFYIESPNGTIINENSPIESGLNLQNVPKAFEPGIPNRYDTIALVMSYPNSFGVSSANGYKVLAAIEDGDGVYQKRLWFCNNLSLPRELVNNTPTGRVYLIS